MTPKTNPPKTNPSKTKMDVRHEVKTKAVPPLLYFWKSPFCLEDDELHCHVRQETPYFKCLRVDKINTTANERTTSITNKIKYTKTRGQLESLVRKRNLIPRGVRVRQCSSWVSKATKWQLATLLSIDYQYRSSVSTELFKVLYLRCGLHADIVDRLFQALYKDWKQKNLVLVAASPDMNYEFTVIA